MRNKLDNYFEITKRGSSLTREIRGGFVTFFTMAYIVILNPIILSGIDSNGTVLDPNSTGRVGAMTALIAGILTISMGVIAKFPLAISAGLGINSVVAVSVATIKGATWADIMGLVVIEGIIIFALVVGGARKAIFAAIDPNFRTAISIGIGLFVTLIGFWDAGFLSSGNGTPLQIQTGGSINSIPVVLFVFCFILIAVLSLKKVKGAILISIITSTVIAIALESVLGLGNSENGWHSEIPKLPELSQILHLPDFTLFGNFNLLGSFQHFSVITAVLLVVSLVLSDFFDTMGTMVAVAEAGGIKDEEGQPIRTQKILIVDSIAAVIGGASSVSSNTAFIESTSGVAEGARTGFSSVVVGILFLSSTFISPLTAIIPAEAVTPALVFVGFLMFIQVAQIDWKDYTVALPAFATIVVMPFAYSITAGIGAGTILYVILNLIAKKRKVHPFLIVCAVLFIIYFAQVPLNAIFAL